MSDAQFAALLASSGVLFAGLGRLVWSMFGAWLRERESDRIERKSDRDADRTERREDRVAVLEVVREVSAGMTALGERVSSLERVFDRHPERISGVHDVAEPEPVPPAARRTPPMGVPHRAITERPFDPRRER